MMQLRAGMLEMRGIGKGFALLFLCLCFCSLAVPGRCDPLPPVTSLYYTVVSAGFGNLNFSLHYEEYGNANTLFSLTTGRYYTTNTVEYTDVANNLYYLETEGVYGYLTCQAYYINNIVDRILDPAVSLLVNLANASVPFNNLGLTSTVRNQPSRHFTATLSWTSSSISNTYAAIDKFIGEAYATAGITPAAAYSVTAIIDVYYSTDSSNNMKVAGTGFIPIRYTITGSRTDGSITRPLNIVYDFMQWTQLGYYTGMFALSPPVYWCYPTTGVPQALPQVGPIGARNTTLPDWRAGGKITVEISSSNRAPVQLDGLIKPSHGQELLIFLADTNYRWYSKLYEYSFNDERNFQFANGVVFTLNGTNADPYNSFDYDYVYQRCTGSTINPGTVSPIQWINGGSLNSIMANPKFFSGAVSTGQQTVRGITCDTWQIQKAVAYNAVVYNFTLTVYVTATGWTNLGRTNSPTLGSQLIRLDYVGTQYPTRGVPSTYTMDFDFFVQYQQVWDPYNENFNPGDWSCPSVPGAVPILPPLPPQYSVSVSETWYDSSTSSQYTVYADTTKNLRRIDGRFTAPNTFSLMTENLLNSNYISMVEWSQNVTLTNGFSSLSLSQPLPYTTYQPAQAKTCGAVTLSAYDWSGILTLNFFDWLEQADPSQGVWVASRNVRGMDVEVYQITVQTENFGHFILGDFEVAYLAADETLINNIPVMAEVVIQFYNFPYFGTPSAQYQFYNFRAGVPDGIFGAPAFASCKAQPSLPAPVITPEWYTVPDPLMDGTSLVAPVWPATFSLMLEGQFFASSGDLNVYTARWYADFNNFRERLDIEPAFNISGVNGVNPQQQSYLYYYTPQAGNTFSFVGGVAVTFNGTTCGQSSITAANMNPLKQVPPGNLFDTFFPATSQTLSTSSRINYQPRWYGTRFDGFYYDEYDWTISTAYNGKNYAITNSLYVSILEWVNNAQAGRFNNTRIPLAITANGAINSMAGAFLSNYNPTFRITHFQAMQPGYAFFDASLLGCQTTANSPWYNIYGDLNANSASTTSSGSSSSSASTATIVGAVVGVIGGLLVLGALIAGYRWWKRGNPLFSKSKAGNGGENELVGVGKLASDDNAPENSLNRASLNNLVKEGNPLDSDTAAPSHANSSDHV